MGGDCHAHANPLPPKGRGSFDRLRMSGNGFAGRSCGGCVPLVARRVIIFVQDGWRRKGLEGTGLVAEGSVLKGPPDAGESVFNWTIWNNVTG